MDETLEIEDELEKYNYTFNETEVEYFQGLYPHQIGIFILSVFCLIPNVFTIYIICKYRLSSTIYWTIVNWSILNVLLILTFIPSCIIPVVSLSAAYYEITLCCGCVLFTFTGLLATLFTFDSFVKSIKFCKYSIAAIWCIIFIFDLIAIVTISVTNSASLTLLMVIEVMMYVVILAFVIKIIYLCKYPSSDETFRLRIRISSSYLVGLSFLLLTDIMIYVHFAYILIAILSTIFIYLNGYVNFIILAYCDPKIKRHFMQMFCKSKPYEDIHFDIKGTNINVVRHI